MSLAYSSSERQFYIQGDTVQYVLIMLVETLEVILKRQAVI